MKKISTILLALVAFFSGLSLQAENKTDVINRAFFGIAEDYSKTDYTVYTVDAPSGAQYNAFLTQRKKGSTGAASLGMKKTLQGGQGTGLISKKSAGYVKKITVLLGKRDGTAEMNMEIYGSHTPYSTPLDLFDAGRCGDLIGKIAHDNDEVTPKELKIEGNYEYFGVKSSYGTFYFQEMKVEWGDEPYVPAECTMTLAAVENGTLEVLNGSTALENGAKVTEGTELTLKATPAAGYEFVTFTLNGEAYASATYTVGDADFTLGATFAEKSYCNPFAGLNVTNKTRYITTLTMTGAEGAEGTIDGMRTEAGGAIYFDKTATPMAKFNAGESVTVKTTGGGEWMHGYLFVDWNKNKEFEVGDVATTHKAGGEFVTYNRITFTDPGGGYGKRGWFDTTGKEMDEESSGWPAADVLPAFVIPEDTKSGIYHARYRLAWSVYDPCSTVSQSKNDQTLAGQGGQVIDFTFEVVGAPAVCTMTLAAVENGTLEVLNGETALENGAKVTEGTVLTLKATPAEGFDFVTFTLNGEAYDQDTYTVGETDFTLGATFAPVVMRTDVLNQKLFQFQKNDYFVKELTCKSGATYILSTFYTDAQGEETWSLMQGNFHSTALVTTVSPGTVKSVALRFATPTSASNKSARVNVYGKNTPYTNNEDMDNTATMGQLIGTIQYGATLQKLEISGNYKYVALKATAGATLTDAEIEWATVGGAADHTMTIATVENGTVEVFDGEDALESGAQVAEGTELTLKATPAEGYEFVTFTINGEDYAEATYTVGADDFTIGATFAEKGYCNPFEGLTVTNNKARCVTTLTMTDSRNNTGTIEGMRVGGGGAIYFDKTATPIGSYYAGESVTVKTTGAGDWMHSYMFVDWNNNKEFEVGDVATTHKAGGEFVTYNRITFTDPGGNKGGWYDVNGNSMNEASQNIATELPAFVIPADTKPGIYHARYRVAWSVYDPCSTVSQTTPNNSLGNHGGQVIDFTFEVKEYVAPERTIIINSSNTALGTVAFVDETVEGNALTTTKSVVKVKATVVDADAYFINWTDGDGKAVASTEEYSYSGETDIELTANFGQHFEITFDQTVSVSNEFGPINSGTFVEVGTDMTAKAVVPSGKVLKALYANDVDVTDELVDGEYSFSVTKAMNFRAEFEDMMTTVEFTKTGNGSIQAYYMNDDDEQVNLLSGDQVVVNTRIYFILQPGEEDEVEKLICNGDDWTSELTDYITEGGKMFEIEAYDEFLSITVNFSDKYGVGVEMVAADEADAEYFTIQGVRVERKNLVPGVYIRRAGDKVEKVLVK